MNTTLISKQYSPNIYITPEGYLVCSNVPIARVGHQTYSKAEGLKDTTGKPLPDVDGWVDVYKDESVLFSQDTIASFENKPVVLGHKMVYPDNWSQEAVGFGTNVRRGVGPLKNNLLADLVITKKDAIDTIKAGHLREISLGYDAAYESDGPGKAHQTAIIGNHIAVVPQGKAGAFCRIYDSVDETVKAIERDKLMSFKEKLKQAFGQAVDSVDTFDEMAKPEAAAQEDAKPEASQPTQDAFPQQPTPAAQQATPQPQAQPAPVQQPMSPAVQQLNQKLDQIIAVLGQLTQSKSGDEKQGEQQATPQPQQQGFNIDPNKPIKG